MKKLAISAAMAVTLGATTANAENIQARLIGYQEVPSVSTPASGEFKAHISRDDGMISQELSYSDLIGTVQQSHIHVGQRTVNGSIVIWLCQTSTTQAPLDVRGVTAQRPP